MSSSQLVRLACVKTAARRTSIDSGVSSVETTAGTKSLLGGLGTKNRRRSTQLPQDRLSLAPRPGVRAQQDHGKNVRIEVFAYGAVGQRAVLIASLSNSVLLVMRVGGGSEQDRSGYGVRSWLLDWPVAGRIQGLCVSPDLQCVLCVTENMEGVYILAVDKLGEMEETPRPITSPDPNSMQPQHSDDKRGEGTPCPGDANRKSSSVTLTASTGITAAATSSRGTARPSQRPAAATAFPSLLHLASRGQRRRATTGNNTASDAGEMAHTPAEPIFIASLARRGSGDGNGQDTDDDRKSRRHSTGSKGSSIGKGGSGSGGGTGAGGGHRGPRTKAPYECLWWAARNGDHFAVIGGHQGEVHFLDLERLDAWVVSPPPPTMARGRVCDLTVASNVAKPRSARPAADVGSRSPSSASLDTKGGDGEGDGEGLTDESESLDTPRHLVAVLETGAVFAVLLERRSREESSGGGSDNDEGFGQDSKVEGEGLQKGSSGGSNDGDDGNNVGSKDDSERHHSRYRHLGASRARTEFAPRWLDVGRGGSGGGSGGTGVRAMLPPTRSSAANEQDHRGNVPPRLQMSVVSRAWGNKCALKILRLAVEPPDAKPGRSGKHPLRTEAVRQVSLPVDHTSPERHGLAAVSSDWAVLASPANGGAPARVTVAPLGKSDRPTNDPARVFLLPSGEHVGGVALLPGSRHSADVENASVGAHSSTDSGSWGLLWSDSGIYRVDLPDAEGRVSPPLAASTKTTTTTAAAGDKGRLSSPVSPSAPPPASLPQSRVSATTPRLTVGGGGGGTGSIAFRRPPPASVRRARELHAAGRVAEAANAAIEALDGTLASPGNSRGGARTGPSRTSEADAAVAAGKRGGATTRMVREDLANSLLEWLVALHLRRSRAGTSNASATKSAEILQEEGVNAVSSAGGVRSDSHRSSAGGSSSNKKSIEPSSDRASPRQPRKQLPSTKSSSLTRSGSAKRKPATVAGEEASSFNAVPAEVQPAPAAVGVSRLERYLLSSVDYDPVQAATLLHAQGESDVAILAGTSRGAMALSGVLRVLAESDWPPRLGERAVEALCRDETGAAVREAIGAGGGTLFAALEPRLQLQMLLSHWSIMFGTDGSKESGVPSETAESTGKSVTGDVEIKETDTAPAAAGSSSYEAIAGVRSHIRPILPALSGQDLCQLISRLAQWCKQGVVLGRRCPAALPEKIEARKDSTGEEESDSSITKTHGSPSPDHLPSGAALEAVEIILESLCELGGRDPLMPGKRHLRAWLRAGCIIDHGIANRDKSDASAAPSAGLSFVGDNSTPTKATEFAVANQEGSLAGRDTLKQWTRASDRLYGILQEEDICSSDDSGDVGSSGNDKEKEGGLPTAARRVLQRVPPVLQGWYDPVRMLMKATGAGCWVASALELKLSRNARGAASAMLHGAATLLQDGQPSRPGDVARVVRGEMPALSRPKPPSLSPSDTGSEQEKGVEDIRQAASTAVLETMDNYVFESTAGCNKTHKGGSGGHSMAGGMSSMGDSGVTKAVMAPIDGVVSMSAALPQTQPHAAPDIILERATVLAEALCVWEHFRLPVATLEEALRSRLDNGNDNDARILVAVLFPMLSPDTPKSPYGNVHRGMEGVATAVAVAWSMPNLAQTEVASKLGLSPRFLLVLTRVGVKLCTPGRPSRGDLGGPIGGVHGTGRIVDDHPASSAVQENRSSSPSLKHSPWDGAFANAWASSTTSPLGLLLEPHPETRIDNGRAGGVRPAWSSRPASLATTSAGIPNEKGKTGQKEMWFSCGHRFMRDDLLRRVVPECISSVAQATSSLQHTQQVLAREYQGQTARAACPVCAAKELGRLVTGLRPAIAVASNTDGSVGNIGRGARSGVVSDASRQPRPPPATSRLQAHEQNWVR